MRIRQQLTYSNVAATLALVIAIGTGGAYAAGEIGSGDIDNNSIRSKDLKNRKAVAGRDVKRNALTGKEIRERTLDATDFAPLASDGPSSCDPTDATFVDCAETSINLPTAGRLLVIAVGEYFSEDGPARLNCRIAIDGVDETAGINPGESTSDNTSSIEVDGFADTRISERLSKGRHNVALRCAERRVSGDGRLATATLAVVGFGGG